MRWTEKESCEGTAVIRCDLVVPVFNGLTYARSCLESIFRHSAPVSYRLIIIDDCSDTRTRYYLEAVAQSQPQVILHRNPENIGFVRSCNIGIKLGTAPYVVLVNSDVVVTPNWLGRLVACAESDPPIGSVNPLTNHASQISVRMPPGANFFGMDWVVRQQEAHSSIDVVTGVGFCLLLRRAALRQVGTLDEIFGQGYCEDSDLCMRLMSRGWRTVVTDGVYVFHRGSGTFRNREQRYRHNRAIFDARWKARYQRSFGAFRAKNPLKPVRQLFSSPQRWDPMPAVWQTARSLQSAWRKRDFRGLALEAVRGTIRSFRNRRDVVSPVLVASRTPPGRLRVTYVLRDLVVAGGVLSVIQLVNELILLGVEARIAATFEDPVIYNWTHLYTQPMVFRSQKELVANLPDTDIAVATLWATASWVADIVSGGKAKQSVYFIQDYEPWFFDEKEVTARRRVRDTFALVENRIVKSDWLKGMLVQDGYSAQKIPLGMDLDQFYPRDVCKTRPALLAMARPGTERRGFQVTIDALAIVKRTIPGVEVVLFGSRGLAQEKLPFDFTDMGLVTDRDLLCRLYSGADVFLDGSDFQGFGRCGLEAMACGTACVLTSVGGVREYARDADNALLVAPRAPEALAEAALTLLRDPVLRKRLGEAGQRTAVEYSHKLEATRTLAYLRSISEQNGTQVAATAVACEDAVLESNVPKRNRSI